MNYIAIFEDFSDVYIDQLVLIQSDKTSDEIEAYIKQTGVSSFLYSVCGNPSFDSDFRLRCVKPLNELHTTKI